MNKNNKNQIISGGQAIVEFTKNRKSFSCIWINWFSNDGII